VSSDKVLAWARYTAGVGSDPLNPTPADKQKLYKYLELVAQYPNVTSVLVACPTYPPTWNSTSSNACMVMEKVDIKRLSPNEIMDLIVLGRL